MKQVLINNNTLNSIKKTSQKKETANKKRWKSFIADFGLFTIVTAISIIILYNFTKNIEGINFWPIILLLITLCEIYYLFSDIKSMLLKKKYAKKTKIIINRKKVAYNG